MTSRGAGQALIEYALCCAVLATALLVSWGGDDPVVVLLARALRAYFRGIGFLLSIA
jgi:hypothetical protein